MQAVEGERRRFFRQNKSGKELDETREEKVTEKVTELNYYKIVSEITSYDVTKFETAWKTIPLGDALIVYSRKIDAKNRESDERFKLELIKLQAIGKWITGEDMNFLDKYEEGKIGKKNKKQINEAAFKKAGFQII